MQLFPTEASAGNGATSGFRDSAFSKNRDVPVHRWVPWIAGFSAQFVDDCLAKYMPRNGGSPAVLDPFAGVGTTLLQAYLHGCKVVGFEINPYAALAARTKLEAAQLSVSEFQRHIGAFERFMAARCPDDCKPASEPRSKPPEGFSGRTELFSPCVERRMLFVLDFIGRIENQAIKNLFLLALGSVMVSMSNYSYEPSLTRRVAVDKANIPDARVASVLSSKLHLMLDDTRWLREQMRSVGGLPDADVRSASILTALRISRKREFVDLVVTSPPYLNNYHYPRNTRPQLHWLGLGSGRGYKSAREDESFGKFWQTVRDLPPVKLTFRLPALSQVAEAIASRNAERGAYGGPGWANYVSTYFNDTHRFCSVLAALLRPKAAAVIVLGNSIIQGVEVRTDRFFGEIGELCGLRFEDTILLRQKRTGNSIIQSSVRVDEAPCKTALYESAIVLRK